MNSNIISAFLCGFLAAAVVGLVIVIFCRKKIMDALDKRFKSITRWLFVTGQFFAILWVSISYVIAIYATMVLGQPYPIETLSEQAIIVLLGTLGAKVVENIFEHNNGGIFGSSEE